MQFKLHLNNTLMYSENLDFYKQIQMINVTQQQG